MNRAENSCLRMILSENRYTLLDHAPGKPYSTVTDFARLRG